MSLIILLIAVFIIIDVAYIYVLVRQTNYMEIMQADLEISKTEIEKQIEFAGKVQEENASLRREVEDLKFDLIHKDRKKENIIKLLETNNYDSISNLTSKIKTILAKD